MIANKVNPSINVLVKSLGLYRKPEEKIRGVSGRVVYGVYEEEDVGKKEKENTGEIISEGEIQMEIIQIKNFNFRSSFEDSPDFPCSLLLVFSFLLLLLLLLLLFREAFLLPSRKGMA
ncbi:hypothetical protein BDW42DRAFT_103128 [Aspergillus taichungensis]|uniref:Uncharacterized protein n=1 Tax=Aspergillus taichungensis TaxID=482145 RepID=A0A2J5HUG1_9EURO|nr:hypothetical protein BDW42DRAFT_103128 [Aspergillus taichungensis]